MKVSPEEGGCALQAAEVKQGHPAGAMRPLLARLGTRQGGKGPRGKHKRGVRRW